MPPFTSASKVANGARNLLRRAANAESNQLRRFGGIAASETPLVRGNRQDLCSSSSSSSSSFSSPSSSLLCNVNNTQRRSFLGCGDGDEGSVLSKVYEEKRILGYTQEQLFNVVASVDMYRDFVPWCQRSDIIRHYPDGSLDAELEIGFKFLVESYVSRVVLERPKRIKTTAKDTTLFDHLINIWEFNPGPVPGSCNLYFLVDFKFQSPLYRQIASMFFKEVVARLVGSLDNRCRLIYGPGVQILENSYGHNA